jgi:hypothetical protein
MSKFNEYESKETQITLLEIDHSVKKAIELKKQGKFIDITPFK